MSHNHSKASLIWEEAYKEALSVGLSRSEAEECAYSMLKDYEMKHKNTDYPKYSGLKVADKFMRKLAQEDKIFDIDERIAQEKLPVNFDDKYAIYLSQIKMANYVPANMKKNYIDGVLEHLYQLAKGYNLAWDRFGEKFKGWTSKDVQVLVDRLISAVDS